MTPAGRRSEAGTSPPATTHPSAWSGFRDRVPATVAQLAPLRSALVDWAAAIGLTGDVASELVLAGYEAMTNVVEHAYGEGSGVLDLEASRPQARGSVVVIVRDQGHWRPPPPGPRLLGGRGLALIEALADNVVIDRSDRGTTVRMCWPYHSKRQAA